MLSPKKKNGDDVLREDRGEKINLPGLGELTIQKRRG
jgi:hypothetical protein